MNTKPNNKYLLAIETASSICSVALFDGDKCTGEESEFSAQRHDEKLAVMVDDLLKSNEVLYDSIATIAVSIGPGSFTGLRVGLSFAKGIALGVGCQIIPINTLEALAITIYRQYSSSELSDTNYKSVFAATVARKIESFGSISNFSSIDEFPIGSSNISLYDADELFTSNIENCLYGGEGIDNLILGKNKNNDVSDIIISGVKASAIAVGQLALRDMSNDNNTNDALTLEPIYINEFTVNKRSYNE